MTTHLELLIDPDLKRSRGPEPETLAELKSLRDALDRELDKPDESARLHQFPPCFPGVLPDWLYWMLAVGLGSSGGAHVLARVIVEWLRQRTSNVTIEVWGSKDKKVRVEAERVRRAGPDELEKIIGDAARSLLELGDFGVTELERIIDIYSTLIARQENSKKSDLRLIEEMKEARRSYEKELARIRKEVEPGDFEAIDRLRRKYRPAMKELQQKLWQ